jgi:hypothetical protein
VAASCHVLSAVEYWFTVKRTLVVAFRLTPAIVVTHGSWRAILHRVRRLISTSQGLWCALSVLPICAEGGNWHTLDARNRASCVVNAHSEGDSWKTWLSSIQWIVAAVLGSVPNTRSRVRWQLQCFVSISVVLVSILPCTIDIAMHMNHAGFIVESITVRADALYANIWLVKMREVKVFRYLFLVVFLMSNNDLVSKDWIFDFWVSSRVHYFGVVPQVPSVLIPGQECQNKLCDRLHRPLQCWIFGPMALPCRLIYLGDRYLHTRDWKQPPILDLA